MSIKCLTNTLTCTEVVLGTKTETEIVTGAVTGSEKEQKILLDGKDPEDGRGAENGRGVERSPGSIHAIGIDTEITETDTADMVGFPLCFSWLTIL